MSATRDTPRGPTATELHRRTLAHEPRRPPLAAMPWPLPVVTLARRCDYCGALSPQGCTNGPCTFHGATSV